MKAGNNIFHFPELRWPLKNGAELLHLETLDGEQRSKEDFLLWWNNQVGNASDDGKTVVVLGAAHPCFPLIRHTESGSRKERTRMEFAGLPT